jgi:hypothetical protein
MQNPAFLNVAVKVLQDPTFGPKLVDNPVETLKAEGIDPSAEMLSALKGISVEDLKKLAADVQSGQAAM